jgi:outer membrane lipoprotein-sorting protein
MKTSILILALSLEAGAWGSESRPVPVAPVLPAASEILARHLQAIGGKEALEKVASYEFKAVGREKEMEFDLRILLKRPNRLRLECSLPNGLKIQSGYDGTNAWRVDPSGIHDLDPKRHDQDFGELIRCLDRQTELAWGPNMAQAHVSKASRDNREVYSLRADAQAAQPITMEFDVKSGLLVHTGHSALDDYRTVDGIQVPHAIRNEQDQTAIRIQAVALNVAMNDSEFTKPGKVPAENRAVVEYRDLLKKSNALEIVRRPPPSRIQRGKLKALPVYDPNTGRPFQVDVRGADLTGLVLTNRLADLLRADFDQNTRWPAQLPAGFDHQKIMDLGKNPGLKVRELHRRGITGKGVGIAIIDQNLLVDHVEYKDRLKLYEEMHVSTQDETAQMHGPAVASIAVGKTCGVAPEADLFYISVLNGEMQNGRFEWDFTHLARAVNRILDLNASLAGKPIRVISISVGWSADQKGGKEITAAVNRAKKEGVFVISTSLETTHKLAFHGLGREPMDDPDKFTAYGPGSWWAKVFLSKVRRFPPGQRLLVPMDSRATASPTGAQDYVFYADGGWSWSVPYLAGLYALACQEKPDITPAQFWAAALDTGKIITFTHMREKIALGTVANPVELMESLRKKK